MKENKGQGLKVSLLYSGGSLSGSLSYLIATYLTYALTNSAGMSAITVGSIFLFSRVFDGFTDVLAGIAIDYLNPKSGKVRVYDLFHVPMWLCLVLAFSVPNVGPVAKVIWVFAFYNLFQSVFQTFLTVAGPMRLQRSFKEEARIKVMRLSTIITMIFVSAVAVLMPQLIVRFGAQPHGWTIITLIFAIPFAICGVLQYLFLPELPEARYMNDTAVEKITFKEYLRTLFSNKYALLFGGIMIFYSIQSNVATGAAAYYFQYVYGDIGASSFLAMSFVPVLVFIALVPKLVEKFGKTAVIRFCLVIIVASHLGKLLMPTNLIWLFIMSIASGMGTMTFGFLRPLINIDIMEFGKWKNGSGAEAAYTTISSVADKLGLGFGSFVLGFILQLANYDGTLAVQEAATTSIIKMCYTVVPSVIAALSLIFMIFFDLEKKIPKIREDMIRRNELLQ